MLDVMTPNSAPTAPLGLALALRDGRPCPGRARKQQQRAHPYRRLSTSSSQQCCAAAGNGHTQQLPRVNGADHTIPLPTLPDIHSLLQRVAAGELDPAAAAGHITAAPTPTPAAEAQAEPAADDAWAEAGAPAEIVWAPGRSPSQVAIALQRAAQDCGRAMAARVPQQVADEVAAILPEAQYHPSACALTVSGSGGRKQQRLPGTVAIIGGGNQAEVAAEEARLAAAALGCYAFRLGAAAGGGVPNLPAAQSATAVIVIGGDARMVAGLTNAPVVAVPVGEACQPAAPGVSTVAHGIAAAVYVARILRAAARIGGK